MIEPRAAENPSATVGEEGNGVVLSICIPFFGKPARIVARAIESSEVARPEGAELIVLPNGVDACAQLRELQLPSETRVIESVEVLTLVDNWNRCLQAARGDLIHILHDDDTVDPDFYRAILRLRRRFPESTLYGTAATEGTPNVQNVEHTGDALVLTGGPAAAFILEDPRFSVGGTVLTRRTVVTLGPFRADFPYCPDEEAFLRYASRGGLAFDPAPLYRATTHELQSRHADWRRPDLVVNYVRARHEGALAFEPRAAERALTSSAKRVITVAVSLTLEGDHSLARHHLDKLAEVAPKTRRWPRYWLARATVRSRLARGAARFRRRLVRTRTPSIGRMPPPDREASGLHPPGDRHELATPPRNGP